MTYADYIQHKLDAGTTAEPVPFVDADILPALYPHQRDLVRWALRRGRAAIFADTGLGKTAMQLEWARHCAAAGRVLILAPLAVAQQTVREGERFGIDVRYCRTDDPLQRITITNYEMLEHFNPRDFCAVVLDESSILKASDGKTRTRIIEAFGETRWRLACTATPAPNDHTELGNHAQFLGIKTREEMLAEYFVHDGGETQTWRLKGHAVDLFWAWVCTWGAVVKRPSDIGHSDDGFDLPALRMHEHIVPVDQKSAMAQGYLFAPPALTLTEQRATRRATLGARAKIAADLARVDEPVLIWTELNDEADAITSAIPGAVQVKGADSPEQKAQRMLGFAAGDYRVLVSKAEICGFGLNFQHCARQIFAGVSHSYEKTYQAIRRSWRFGQKRPVDIHIIRAETEDAIVANLRRKEADAERMAVAMVEHMRETMRAEISSARREWNPYDPQQPMQLPHFLRAS